MARLFLLVKAIEESNAADKKDKSRQAELVRNNFFITQPDHFISSYRLSEELINQLDDDLSPFMRDSTRGIRRRVKILCALAFLANGSYQHVVGQQLYNYMAQSSVSRALHEFIDAIVQPQVLQKYLKFPQNHEERNLIKKRFYEKFKFAHCIGCIDGTFVAMIRPTQNEERYFCRKGYHARNVQLITDADLNIIYVDASYGGASHDNYIFSQGAVKRHLEDLIQSGDNIYLLGDSGYAQRTCVMTPLPDTAESPEEQYYNTLHKTARNSVERTIGLLKGRFRCMLTHRVLHYDPDTVAKIVVACCVLHNLCNRAGLPAPVCEPDDLSGVAREEAGSMEPSQSQDELALGRLARNDLIARLWHSP